MISMTAASGPMAMDAAHIVGIFVGVPFGVFVIVVVLTYAPSWVRNSRHRSGSP